MADLSSGFQSIKVAGHFWCVIAIAASVCGLAGPHRWRTFGESRRLWRLYAAWMDCRAWLPSPPCLRHGRRGTVTIAAAESAQPGRAIAKMTTA